MYLISHEEMPRRKQDKPQHLEEDMKMDQLISGAVRDCVQNMRPDGLVNEKDVDRDHIVNNIKDCNGLAGWL